MVFRNLVFSLGLLGTVIAPATAQDDEKSQGAKPKDLREWAGKIQQDYPSAALRNAEQGTVTMRIGVGADGRVHSCEVTGTSDSEALDEAACRGMTEYARYEPARNQSGKPVADTETQSVRYVLPDNVTPMHFTTALPLDEDAWRAEVFDDAFAEAIEESETKRALFLLIIGEEGNPTGCGMLWPSGDAELDRRTCARLLENARFEPAELRGGATVPGTYLVGYPSFEALQSLR